MIDIPRGIPVIRYEYFEARRRQQQMVMSMWKKGQSADQCAQMASRIGPKVTPGMVLIWCYREGIERGAIQKRPTVEVIERRDQMLRAIELSEKGLPNDIIAERVSTMGETITTSQVGAWIRRSKG